MDKGTPGNEMVEDILDTDVYDCSHINALLELYPGTYMWMVVVDRDHAIYKKGFAGLLKEKFQDLRRINADPALQAFLKNKWGFLSERFFKWLAKYKFVPEYIDVWQDEEGRLFGKVLGPTEDIIFCEQICMAIISQTRNEVEGFLPDDNWVDVLIEMIYKLVDAKTMTSEFGMRRRAYNWMQKTANEMLIKHGGIFTEGGIFTGSSDPYYSRMSNTAPKGTQGHIWTLFHCAKFGVEYANQVAQIGWRSVYGQNVGTGLTDTLTSDFFWATLSPEMARLIKSFRHDSGDPYVWTRKMFRFMTDNSIGVDPKSILAIYTDGLDEDKAIAIDHYAKKYFQSAVGIGGALTNNRRFFTNCPAYKPLNLVVKPYAFSFDEMATWRRVAKVPDTVGKTVGDDDIVKQYLEYIKLHPYPFAFSE